MKSFTFFIVICALIALSAGVRAQGLEEFTAMTGANAAREKIAQLGLVNPKLILFNSYAYNGESIYNYTGEFNSCHSGHALNWQYTFAYNADNRVITISSTKVNGNIALVVKDDLLVTEYNERSRFTNFDYVYLRDFIEIPNEVLDSDFPAVIDQQSYLNVIHFKTSEYTRGQVCLTSQNNCPMHGLKDNTDTCQSCDFIWYYIYTGEAQGLDGTLSSGGTIAYFFSARTGKLFGKYMTLNVKEESAELNINIYPNPAKDYVQINGIKENERMEIFSELGVKILETEYTSSIDIRNFTNGIYCCKVFRNNKVEIVKFVVWK